MKFDDRTLRINSATLIFLTIISMVMLIGEMMANQFSVAAIMQMTDTTEGMARIIMGICIGLFCLVFLMTLITGLQGIRQAGGKCKGGANVVLATIVLVLKILSVVAGTYFIARGKMDSEMVFFDLLYICFLIPYIMCAKRV